MNSNTPTGLDMITGTLTRGSTGDQVKALQQYLIGMGKRNVKADGVFGPMTEQAVRELQAEIGVASDGRFGPQTLARARTVGSTSETPTTPKTQEEIDAEYTAEVAKNSRFSANSADALSYAISTGDFSGLVNEYGQPFSNADQEEAMRQAEDALAPGYEAGLEKNQADTEADLQQQQADYDKYLAEQATSFQEDKTGLDQTAADKGVLFSGGRAQKETNLSNTYSQNAEYNKNKIASNIGSIARDFQYKYGNDAANNLSNYYRLGGQNYNANVATGGATSTGLSNVYNPRDYDFDGTENLANRVNINTRAADLLRNRANRLVRSGLSNQYR